MVGHDNWVVAKLHFCFVVQDPLMERLCSAVHQCKNFKVPFYHYFLQSVVKVCL